MTPGRFTSCRLEAPSVALFKPTLLFLPGTLCDARVWEKTYQALGEDWPCAFIDYLLETSIAAMAAVALAQVPGTIIPVGVSMGGIVGLEIWRQAAQRTAALALFDMDPGADSAERRALRAAQIQSARRQDLRKMVESQLLPAYFPPPSAVCSSTHPSHVLPRDMVVSMALAQGIAAFEAQSTALGARLDSWPLLKDIDVPVLVACGENDHICPPHRHELMAKQLPRGSFALIGGAGHLAPLEQPRATAQRLQAWLSQLPV